MPAYRAFLILTPMSDDRPYRDLEHTGTYDVLDAGSRCERLPSLHYLNAGVIFAVKVINVAVKVAVWLEASRTPYAHRGGRS